MKIGMRKPSLIKRVATKTSVKRQVVHRAGLKMPKGYGWVRNPKKAAYNKDIIKPHLIF
ncbi:MAG: Ribosomal protein L32 [Virgibacillus proomii]